MQVRSLACKFVAQILLLVLFFCAQLRCDLTPHFREFLDQKYGTGTGTKMSRVDMGQLIGGSFGGKREQHDPVIDQPVIFIHGVTLRASVFMQHRNYFLNKGYSPAELYATTYSDGGQTPFYNNELKCKDVKHIREFIQAVHQYTNSTVDIIAYSMGCAISRKALLGGHCADTGEALGPPLTSMVDTFVSVGGVAYGMERCPTNLPACNEVTGMICTSAYMRNVNGQPKRYEGANSFGIYSKEDGIVGQQCCDHPCSELKNANQNIALRYHDHISIFTRTMAMQYSLVSEHTTGEEAEGETKNARGRR